LYLAGTESQQLTDEDVQRVGKALRSNTTFSGALYLSNNGLTDQVD
jgi:hypothetical protein